MKNENIIFNARLELMKTGIIGTTGNTIIVEDKKGVKKEIIEPEIIHTYSGWRERGRQVKKGEKAIADFPIWKYKRQKSKEEMKEGKEIMFLAKAFWFKEAQTEEMAKGYGKNLK